MDKPTTKRNRFFDITLSEHKLLSVNAGVPAEEALDFASMILAESIALMRSTASDVDTHEAWAAVHLAEMVKAVVDAASLGLSKGGVQRG